MKLLRLKEGYVTQEAAEKQMSDRGVWAGSYWENKFSKTQYYIGEIYYCDGRVSQESKVLVVLVRSSVFDRPQKRVWLQEFYDNYTLVGGVTSTPEYALKDGDVVEIEEEE